MTHFPEHLKKKLDLRIKNNSLRILNTSKHQIDFSSNDYLGFSKNTNIALNASTTIATTEFINGSTGSRLVSGSHPIHNVVETELAEFHNAEAALLFNSGYDANIGLFSSILQKGDTIIYDELIHASIRDGIRLSNAKSYNFKHNSLEDLEKKISKSEGTIYVAIESIYSMDGDSAAIQEIIAICNKHNCLLIVDEAHSNGIYGKNGQGLLQHLNLEQNAFARIHTFGKALGCHGAVILGSEQLKSYLINFCRSLIYTTAASLHSVAIIKSAYKELVNTTERQKLTTNISTFKQGIHKSNIAYHFIDSNSPIHCLIIPGNDKVKRAATSLQEKGYDVKAILSPTVPKGEERLRICIHSTNTQQEIEGLIEQLTAL